MTDRASPGPNPSGVDVSIRPPSDTPWRGNGLHDFFLYRDPGVAEATHGKVLVQLMKAQSAPEQGAGWHRHEAALHVVIMAEGLGALHVRDQETLVAAGDCVHQRPGIRHYLFDSSPDMEYLIVSPADFGTVDVEAPCSVAERSPRT
jgi:quercetin dioxygenase-like cupin family protein